MNIRTVVFDIGGVLIDWNPRYLYRKILKDDFRTIEYFLENVCNYDWNAQQDAGRTYRAGVSQLKKQHPQYADLIEAYDKRWEEMLGDVNRETLAILKQLKRANMPLYALTNWSAEKFPIARKRYNFFNLFDDIFVSGEIGVKKPDLEFYRLFLTEFNIKADEALFIDDLITNIEAANQVGMNTIHFIDAQQLKKSLNDFGLLLHLTQIMQ